MGIRFHGQKRTESLDSFKEYVGNDPYHAHGVWGPKRRGGNVDGKFCIRHVEIRFVEYLHHNELGMEIVFKWDVYHLKGIPCFAGESNL